LLVGQQGCKAQRPLLLLLLLLGAAGVLPDVCPYHLLP
jgi:hypothetical protein